MFKTEKWIAVSIVLITLSLIVNGCFKHSKDEETGSSVPAPGAFTLGAPADGAININIAATEIPASWTASTDVANYLLEICKDDAFVAANSVYSTTLASNVTLYSVPTATLTSNMWYYWRVTATNASGSVIASNVPFSFYTGSSGAAPGTFNLSAPVDNASGISLTPELVWTNAVSETLYTAYLDDNISFSTPYITTTKPGVLNTVIPGSAALTDTVRYYWKVEASNTVTSTVTTSTVYSFVTGPIEYYLITPTVTTITAGESITATLTAYGTDDAQVITHAPFVVTMSATSGVTFYEDNTLITSTITYTLTSGVANMYFSITTAGSAVITATDIVGRVKNSSGTAITVNPGVSNKLVFATQPTTTAVDAAFSPVVTVKVQDVYGNTVTTASNVITLTVGAQLISLGGAFSATASGGVATFTGVTVGGVSAPGYVLSTVNDDGLSEDTSTAFTVTGFGAIDSYLVEVTVNPIGSGVTGTGTATALDIYGNTVTTAATTLTMTKTDEIGTPTVAFYTAGDATGTVNNVYSTWSSGVLTFYYTATGTAGWDFTITATDVALKTGTSVSITIGP